MRLQLGLWTGLVWAAVSAASAADTLQILPAEISLTGPQARSGFLVVTASGPLVTGLSGVDVRVTTDNEQVATIEKGQVIPRGNGTCRITASDGTRTATAQVTVTRFDAEPAWSFRNHVQSVLSKTGCNSGPCHGAAAGKNGFKLSLRGYDPEADFFAITRQARGRRVVPSDPGRSLILTKPTGAVPHKGGFRFAEDSLEYRVIAEWIAQGQVAPAADDARIVKLEMLPEASRLAVGVRLPMVVRAHFSDGRIEDVTEWAKYTATQESVCSVNDQGLVTVTGSGEGAIVAWYLAQNATSTVAVAYQQPVPEAAFATSPLGNRIDRLVLDKLVALNIPPSPPCDDGTFLRRAMLDTIGVLPTPEETLAFLEDTDPEKRSKLIDRLLARPEFVDYWTYQWSDLLLLTGSRLRPEALKSYSRWIRERVANNTPWDQFAAGIILAKGSTFENGAANFYALHQDPQDMVETTSMAFLGMSIQCAHCHDHPNEKWTNDDYYGMVSLFARVRGKGWGGDFRNGDGNRTIFLDEQGEVLQPRTGKPQRPRPLDGEPISFEDPTDRREHLVRWLVAPSNPYFSRAIVNRIWANYLGRGLVEGVDDLRQTNPASNEVLLTTLAGDLVSHGYDLKWLMRTILMSETYQRSATVLPENAVDSRFYSRAMPRRLKAEVLLDAIAEVTQVPTLYKDQPVGTRALQLPDASVGSYFLDTFGRPERLLTCTCERSDEPTMTQVLHLTNGKTIQEKIESKTGRVADLLGAPPADVIQTLYLAAYARRPTAEEQSRLAAVLESAPESERRQVLEDLFWSVLTSKEFLFQH